MPLDRLSLHVRSLSNPTPAEKERVIRILCDAFAKDFFTMAMTHGPPELLSRFFTMHLQLCLNTGEVLVATLDNYIIGALLLYGPGHDILEPGTNEWFKESDDYVAQLSDRMQHWWMAELRPRYQKLMNETFGRPDGRRNLWFIKYIGIDPPYQRKGVGASMLNVVFQKSNASQIPIYTETAKDMTNELFLRRGFVTKAVKSFVSAEGGFPIFALIRKPQVFRANPVTITA